MKTWYHGSAVFGLQKFDSTKFRRFGPLGRGVYLTDNTQAAKYYSMVSGVSEDLKKLRDRPLSEQPAMDVRAIYLVALVEGIRLQYFNRMPTMDEAEAVQRAGFDGIECPDEGFKYTEDWCQKTLGEFPINPMAVMVFDPKNVTILREIKADSLGMKNTPAAPALPNKSTRPAGRAK